MKTILFLLFAVFLLILFAHWSQAGFLLPQGCGGKARPGGEPICFAYDVRLNTYNGRMEIVRQGALDAMKTLCQGWYTGSGAPAGSIEVEYFHIPLGEHCAAVAISGGSHFTYGEGGGPVEWRGSPPALDKREHMSARIKILPRVFDRRAYWITAENRWAETAVEAVKAVVLEGVVHVERYVSEQPGRPVRLLASIAGGDAPVNESDVWR